MKKLLPVLAAAMLCAAPALANDTPAAAPNHASKAADGFFAKVDTDKDGNISKAEFAAYNDKMFAEKDTNNDGQISKEEFVAAKAKKHAEMKAKKADKAPAAK